MLAMAGPALGQVELVDPDAPNVRRGKAPRAPADAVDPEPAPPSEEADDPTGEEPEPEVTDEGAEQDSVVEDTARPVVRPTVRGAKDAGPPAAAVEGQRRDADRRAAPAVAPLKVERVTDADLEQAWLRWKKVERGQDVKAEQAARAELLSLKHTIGATDLEPWAMGMLRASAAHQAQGDSGAAVELALTAAELAPSLPAAWSGLAWAYFEADPSDLGRYLTAMGTAVARELDEARYQRAALADVVVVLLAALVLTAVAVVVVLFIRRAYYFFYDFHFFFPRVAARWQTTAAAVLLLSLPVVFRLGLAPALLALFAATTLYLSLGERLLAGGLIAVLGLVPTLGALGVEASAFAETPAARLALIERGGPGVEPAVQQLEALAAEDKAGFAELYVIGRHHLRRGQLDRAMPFLQKALAMSPQDVGARVNTGVAFFLSGDLENSRAILEAVTRDARHPLALYDLGRVYQRRVAVYGELSAAEVDKGMSALSLAAQLDPRLPRPSSDDRPTEPNANQLARTVPLDAQLLLAQATAGDAPERVRAQLAHLILGEVPEPLGGLFPALLAALLVGFGSLGLSLGVAKECTRCGMAVSTRGDPDVSRGSLLCTQCVNVFAKKNVVAPSLKVRKQLEIARYQARRERTGLALGALCAGLGHIFSGWPLRGALFAFLFLCAAVFAALRQGVLRAPYDAVPSPVKLAPLLGLALVVYVLSLRGLRKRQG